MRFEERHSHENGIAGVQECSNQCTPSEPTAAAMHFRVLHRSYWLIIRL